MQELDDTALLREFVEHDSAEAFAALVTRHIDKVYSVALRHTRNPHEAEEITQTVFVILARKSNRFGKRVILEGWLYQTARLTALTFIRSEIRRARREQESHMQTILNENDFDVWRQIAPLLDAAMASLNETDRHALVLRFFYGKSMKEVGAALGGSEGSATLRLHRAVEKLRQFFLKRGIASTTDIIAGAISANSVQAAPVALAKSVTAMAVAKGAAASASNLTLIRGALKLMAWAKAKTTIIAGVAVLLTAGTIPVIVKEIQENRTYSWEVPKVYDPAHASFDFGLDTTPPQVRIKPSIYTNFHGSGTTPGFGYVLTPDGTAARTNYNNWQSIGLGETVADIVSIAYGGKPQRTIYSIKMPQKPLYDFISNLRHGTAQPLQELIKKKFGIVGKWELRETNVLLVTLAKSNAPAFKPAGTLMRSMNITGLDPLNYAMGIEWKWVKGNNGVPLGQTHFNVAGDDLFGETGEIGIEGAFELPIINETGLTNRYDYTWLFPQFTGLNDEPDARKKVYADALREQLGLKLVPARRTIEMLVVEREP